MSKWGFLGSGQGQRRSAVVLTVMVALIVGAFALVTDAGASSSTHLVKVARAALIPAGARALGVPSASASQTGDVALKPRDPAALEQYVANIEDRTSPSYHHYLAAGQFAAQFGPTQSTIAAVKAQLTSRGLKITSVSRNGMLVAFSGSTSDVESAFSTTLERYQTATGTIGEETTSPVEFPSNVSADVLGVIGLDTLFHPTTDLQRGGTGHAKATKANVVPTSTGPSPCPDAENAATMNGGLTDDQIANAYGATPLYANGDTGQNVHVGIYELEPYETSDIKTFDECYFGKAAGDAMITNQLDTIPVDGGQQSGPGSGEAVLDIDDVSALAPGADIDVYEAANTSSGALDEYGDMVDADTDQVITSSWGECEQNLEDYSPGVQQSEYYIFEQAAAQGQTVLNSSGDTGDDNCNDTEAALPPPEQNPLSVSDPASQPDVLAVGATTLQDADPADFSETVWNDGAAEGGSGGGFSQTWTAPSWQQVSPGYTTALSTDLPNANSVETTAGQNGISNQDWTPGFCAIALGTDPTDSPCRALPDVSAQGDQYTGSITVYSSSFTFGYNGGWFTYGGTSSSSPIWAAMLALVDSSPTCQADGLQPPATPVPGALGGIGFVSPLLYTVADSSVTEPDTHSEYSDAFHDITTGNIDVYGFDDGKVFPARSGYDLASGLGSPVLSHALASNPDMINPGSPGLATDLCVLSSNSANIRPNVTGLNTGSGAVTNGTASGSVAGGTSLTIDGSNFAPTGGATVASVTVGDDVIDASSLTVNPAGTSIMINGGTPAATLSNGATGSQDGSGPADIAVTMSNGASSLTGVASRFNYVDGSTAQNATPTVSSVGPYDGSDSPTEPVTIYGSGFTPAGDTVSFGGEHAASYTYISSSQLKVTPPDFTEGTTDCATSTGLLNLYGGTAASGGDGLTTARQFDEDDVCQTNVQVTSTANGASAEDALLPDIEGVYPESNPDGTITPPPGTELFAQPTEFDYLPTPNISSITTSIGPADYAAAQGGTEIEIDGTGLNYDNYVNFGDPTAASSEDDQIEAVGGTYIDIVAPATADDLANGTPSTDSEAVPVTVETPAGLSNVSNATYAGLPEIDSVALSGAGTGTDTYQGTTYPVGPDSGGSSLTIDGDGMSDVIGPLAFVDDLPTGNNLSTQYSFTTPTDDELDTETVKQNPAVLDTELCTVSGCATTTPSLTAAGNAFLQYSPGTPSLSSVSVDSDAPSGAEDGPAVGGTVVTLTGQNLGCTTEVYFGTTAAEATTNAPTGTDCGSGTLLTAVAPAGVLGTTVPITVATVASDVAGLDPTTETGGPAFTYAASPTFTIAPYGSVNIGSSETATATVTNTGDHDLTLGGLNSIPASVIGDDPSEFTISNDNCSGVILGAGDSCTIEVGFTPSSDGAQDALLDLPFNASTADLTVPLTGTGTVPTNTVTTTVTTPGPTVTTPGATVTTPGPTVTTPGTTVTTPGQTTTVTVTQYYVCLGTPYSVYKTVKVRVRVRVKVKINGKYKYAYRYEYKTEKKKTGTAYHYKCKLVPAADAPKNASPTKAGAEAKARVVARAKAAAAAKAKAARKS